MGFNDFLKAIDKSIKETKDMKNNNNNNTNNKKEQFNNNNDDNKISGIAIYIFVIIIILICAILYAIIRSFYLAMVCNYGDSDTRTVELIFLIISCFLFPIINVVYVFWKPSECDRAPKKKKNLNV